ncbi:MAG: DUF2339 domain-containing protein [Lysobacter sp.]
MGGLIGLIVLVVLAVPVMLIIALTMISALKSRVAWLETQVAHLQSSATAAASSEPTLGEWMRTQQTGLPPVADAIPERPKERPVATAPPPRPPSVPASAEAVSAVATPPPTTPADAPARAAPERSYTPRPPQSRPPSPPDTLTLAARAMRRWFSEGNVPVKVGMLVLFAGVAALLKYAADEGWMRFPIELRLAGVALAAMAGLVFGWRQRESKRSFALGLQGGAIGVLLLVVFAAFKLYHLIPAGAAFALSIVLVAGAGVLAVRQNAIALALLGILAGFLAPLWLSTGQGNHVALFGYYAVLNAGIFAIAWWRPWRALNVLGFVFTFAIGTLWGVLRYRPQDFATTEPFLLLFFAFYLLIPILYAWRRAPGKRDLLDGCLVFGMPLVAFSLQAGLLEGERMPLAFCALALGALYGALAWWLQRREHFQALVAPYAVLAVGFETLAVPLALSAHATASVFALEGAALAWLGLRQRRTLPQLAGALLQIGAATGFAIGVEDGLPATQAIANAAFMGALLIALAGLASAWCYRRAGSSQIALPYYLWGLAWWAGNGLSEIDRFVEPAVRADILLAFVAVTGWIAAEMHRREPARALAWTTVVALAAALPLTWLQDEWHAQPFAGIGAVVWLVYGGLGWRALRCLREHAGAELALAHAAWLVAWSLALSLGLHDLGIRAAFGEGWLIALVGLPWLLLAALVQWRPQVISMPLAARFEEWRASLQRWLVLLLAAGAGYAMFAAGDSKPLPWVPLINPLDLAQLAAITVVAAWLHSDLAPDGLRARRVPLLAAAGFILVSAVTLRATHHWGGMPWSASMFSSGLVQTSLTVVWSLLGVVGWILGARRGQRALWLAGAVLMAVVLAKLVLVDRGHLGNLLGIASFIAYGLLCTAVGYFAPAPPRSAAPLDHEEAAA